MPDYGEVLGCVVLALSGLVLAEGDLQQPVQRVLDALERQQAVRTSLVALLIDFGMPQAQARLPCPCSDDVNRALAVGPIPRTSYALAVDVDRLRSPPDVPPSPRREISG